MIMRPKGGISQLPLAMLGCIGMPSSLWTLGISSMTILTQTSGIHRTEKEDDAALLQHHDSVPPPLYICDIACLPPQ